MQALFLVLILSTAALLGNEFSIGAGLAALPPTARAGDDYRDHPDGLRQELQALKAQVEALQGQNAALQNQVNALQDQLTSAQTQLADAQPVLALAPFVSVNPNPQVGVAGPNITFKGANLHLVSGSGRTDDGGNARGLGNLIIGYDEDPLQLGPAPLQPGDRGGSHNVVIGRYHRFKASAFGGLVAGELNAISALGASVSGGIGNRATGNDASITGGRGNLASGIGASVSGGAFNTASGLSASVSGGGGYPALQGNTASGSFSVVLGGQGNTAGGPNAVVLGGTNVTANNVNSVAPGVPLNFP